MDREDQISKHWKMNTDNREPWMDANPNPFADRGHFDPRYEGILKENRQKPESEEQRKARVEKQLLVEAINRIASSEDGYRFLRHMCAQLAFKDPIMSMVNGEPSVKNLVFNEARRQVWIYIRELLSVPNRNRIEEDQ